MALLYIDGFDHYTTSTGIGNRVWDIAPSVYGGHGSQATHGAVEIMPELGSMGLRINSVGNGGISNPAAITKTLPEAVGSGDFLGIGFHAYLHNLGGSSTGGILSFHNSNNHMNGTTIRIAGGVITIHTGAMNGGTKVYTSTVPLSVEVLYHLEFQIHFHASAGSVACRINGVPAFEATGINTLEAGPYTRIGWGNRGTNNVSANDSPFLRIDNLYIYDDEPGIDDWLGERIVSTLFPDADEAPQDWALSEGSDAYDLLNDVPADDDTFIESNDTGDTSRFGLTDLANPNTSIAAIQVNFRGSKTGTDPTSVRANVHSGSETGEGTPHPLTQDQFLNFETVFELNPDTNQPFEPGEINSLEVSIERTE